MEASHITELLHFVALKTEYRSSRRNRVTDSRRDRRQRKLLQQLQIPFYYHVPLTMIILNSCIADTFCLYQYMQVSVLILFSTQLSQIII